MVVRGWEVARGREQEEFQEVDAPELASHPVPPTFGNSNYHMAEQREISNNAEEDCASE